MVLADWMVYEYNPPVLGCKEKEEKKKKKKEGMGAAAAASRNVGSLCQKSFSMDFNTLNSLPSRLMYSCNKQLYYSQQPLLCL